MAEGNVTPHLKGFSSEMASLSSNQMTTTTETTVNNSTVSTNAMIYFQSFAIVIGVVGTAANAVVLYALCAAKQHKNLKNLNVLFIDQLFADLFSCVMLVVTFSFYAANIYLDGPSGYWLCIFIISQSLLFIGLTSSVLNLAAIAIERYLMIVHPVWHKNKFRDWMIYAAVAFIWAFDIGTVAASVVPTTALVDGVCVVGATFVSFEAELAYGIWNFISSFAIQALIFFYCYGRVLVVIRRQVRVKPTAVNGSGAAPAEAAGKTNAKLTSSELNAVATMIVITVLFVVSSLPLSVYALLYFATIVTNFVNDGFYAMMFVAFLNIVLNPFIYAAKYDVVRNHLQKMFGCGKSASKPSVASAANTAQSTGQEVQTPQLG